MAVNKEMSDLEKSVREEGEKYSRRVGYLMVLGAVLGALIPGAIFDSYIAAGLGAIISPVLAFIIGNMYYTRKAQETGWFARANASLVEKAGQRSC